MDCNNIHEFVIETINDISTKHSDAYVLNNDKYIRIDNGLCECLEEFISTLQEDGDEVVFEITHENHGLVLKFTCPEIIFEHGRSHVFFRLIKMVDSFSFSKINENILLSVNINDLWKKVNG